MDMSNLAQRLESKFGLGTRPDLRRALYQRLESLVESAPEFATAERVFQCVASAAADAVGKQKPGNYFAFVVLERLREKGLVEQAACPI